MSVNGEDVLEPKKELAGEASGQGLIDLIGDGCPERSPQTLLFLSQLQTVFCWAQVSGAAHALVQLDRAIRVTTDNPPKLGLGCCFTAANTTAIVLFHAINNIPSQ